LQHVRVVVVIVLLLVSQRTRTRIDAVSRSGRWDALALTVLSPVDECGKTAGVGFAVVVDRYGWGDGR
jgi:hypothetical protein